MRQIKFRGKCVEEFHTHHEQTEPGQWIYGYLVDEKTITHKMSEEHGGVGPGIVTAHIEVNPKTVGQFTDILAKGEVYDGTILHFPNMEEYIDVFYNEGAFWVLFENDNEPTLLTQKLIEANYVTVAGNIHDNPELLEEGVS